MLITYKLFKQNPSMLFENNLSNDKYWFGLDFKEFLKYTQDLFLKTEDNLIFVSEFSENNSLYKDKYRFPILVYCEKNKVLDFFKNSSIQTTLNESPPQEDSPEIISKNDLEDDDTKLDDVKDTNDDNDDNDNIESSSTEEVPSENKDLEKEDDSEEEEKEPPEEITINTNNFKFNTSVIASLDIDVSSINTMLDRDTKELLKLLKLKVQNKKVSDELIRERINDKFKIVVTDFCKKNNIIINFSKK